MAELGIIASVVQIADVGLRLSIKLYTFGEIVSNADRSVISISKDVSLTSSVLKELGSLLDKDESSRIVSENAVQTAGKVVKECLEVFEEIDTILVKKMPNLRASAGERRLKAVVLLERVKWSYLQPKLQLLRSNLDRLKSTLLLMLNVITYAGQVAGRSEPSSVIEDQRSLIEDLARSNQDYIRKFESLKLGIEDNQSTQDAYSQKGGISREMGWHLQEQPQVNSQRGAPRKRSDPQEAHAPHMNTGIMFPSTSVHNMPVKQEPNDTKPQREMQDNEPAEDELFSHLKHYLSLVNNLLNEVDELKYDIRVHSRDRVKVEILRTYKHEMKILDTPDQRLWGSMAAKPIAPLVSGLQKHLHQAQQRQNQQRVKQYQRQDTVGQCMMAPPIVNPKPFVQSADFYPQQHSYMNSSEQPSATPTMSHSALAFGSQSRRDVPQTYAEPSWIAQGSLDLPDSKRRQPKPEMFGETSLSAQGAGTLVDESHASYYTQLAQMQAQDRQKEAFDSFLLSQAAAATTAVASAQPSYDCSMPQAATPIEATSPLPWTSPKTLDSRSQADGYTKLDYTSSRLASLDDKPLEDTSPGAVESVSAKKSSTSFRRFARKRIRSSSDLGGLIFHNLTLPSATKLATTPDRSTHNTETRSATAESARLGLLRGTKRRKDGSPVRLMERIMTTFDYGTQCVNGVNHDPDPDTPDGRRSVVDDLIEMWTLLPVKKATV